MSRASEQADRLGAWPEWARALVLSGTMIAVAALASALTGQPLVFASLGPTVYLLVESPLTRRASPHNILVGHGVAIAVGWIALVMTRLAAAPPATQVGVSGPRVAAIVIALALTAGLLVLLDASHPPAAATCLLIALGTMHTGRELLSLAAGVILLTATGLVINLAQGLPVLRWK